MYTEQLTVSDLAEDSQATNVRDAINSYKDKDIKESFGDLKKSGSISEIDHKEMLDHLKVQTLQKLHNLKSAIKNHKDKLEFNGDNLDQQLLNFAQEIANKINIDEENAITVGKKTKDGTFNTLESILNTYSKKKFIWDILANSQFFQKLEKKFPKGSKTKLMLTVKMQNMVAQILLLRATYTDDFKTISKLGGLNSHYLNKGEKIIIKDGVPRRISTESKEKRKSGKENTSENMLEFNKKVLSQDIATLSKEINEIDSRLLELNTNILNLQQKISNNKVGISKIKQEINKLQQEYDLLKTEKDIMTEILKKKEIDQKTQKKLDSAKQEFEVLNEGTSKKSKELKDYILTNIINPLNTLLDPLDPPQLNNFKTFPQKIGEFMKKVNQENNNVTLNDLNIIKTNIDEIKNTFENLPTTIRIMNFKKIDQIENAFSKSYIIIDDLKVQISKRNLSKENVLELELYNNYTKKNQINGEIIDDENKVKTIELDKKNLENEKTEKENEKTEKERIVGNITNFTKDFFPNN